VIHLKTYIALDHLDRMTDSTGLIQHAIYSVPRRESGYTLDDNARALRLCTRLWNQHHDARLLDRITHYLSFVEFARRPGGGFHNLLSYQRHWLDTDPTGDCQGQAVRALAEVVGGNLPDDYRALARELLEGVIPALAELQSLRVHAYVILAWGHLWKREVRNLEPLENLAWLGAQRLVECFQRSQRPEWQWFEFCMTYANAVLPHALFVASESWPSDVFRDVAEQSFTFLDRQTTVDGFFWPVGNCGWCPHGEEKAPYDQQPVEAVTMADAALSAFGATRKQPYLDVFRRCHAWFHGQNSLGQSLVNPRWGACGDGLQPTRVNRNQGAESTLAYLWTEVLYSEARQLFGDNQESAVAG